MTSDPVSWLVIEPGWDVVASDGTQVGTVQETVGDTGTDIFNGLAVSPGLLRTTRYVPAEIVGRIEEGRVHLKISHGDFDALADHDEPPPSQQFRAE